MMVKKRWKIFTALMLVIVLALPAYAASAQTIASTTVYINNQPITTTAIKQNGYQLVPASFFRKLNVSVGWSTRYRSAVLSNEGFEISFPIGERHADYHRVTQQQWNRDHLDTRTTLIGGVSYVPLAYTAKKLGLSIQYNAKLRAAVISITEASFVALAKQGELINEPANQATSEELHWLYQITEAEAGGESYEGKIAVAASILNRVANPNWPNSIIDTIFQVEYVNGKAYYQYSPVLDKRIHNVTPSDETKHAVQEAINGSDPSLGAVVFYNPKKTDNAWVRSRAVTTTIGNHTFAK
jgi:hypothetical protein